MTVPSRTNSITRVLEDSVTGKVLDRTRAPVRVVTGNAVSLVELAAIPLIVSVMIGIACTSIM